MSSTPPATSEFCVDAPRHAPSLRLEVGESAPYGNKQTVGLTETDTQPRKLSAEQAWLMEQIVAALAPQWELHKDYKFEDFEVGRFVHAQPGRRRTLKVVTERAAARLPWAVTTLQELLCRMKHDWILEVRCSSVRHWNDPRSLLPPPEDTFLLWICPDKVLALTPHALTVSRRLGLTTNPP